MPDADSMGYDGDESKMPKIPMRRDTWMVAPGGYTVFRLYVQCPLSFGIFSRAELSEHAIQAFIFSSLEPTFDY
jgi:hypothetical protein